MQWSWFNKWFLYTKEILVFPRALAATLAHKGVNILTKWRGSGRPADMAGYICLSDCIVEERKESRGGVMIGYDTR